MSLYSQRGVSAQKEEVHKATAKLDKGLYPHAFCKVFPDYLTGDEAWVNIMHADGAGTKSILAYLYWKETGDLSVWKGVAQDAVVMNLDDMLCVGVYNNLLFCPTIDRNKRLIPGEVLEAIINGTQELFDELSKFGINIHYLGGETADIGDIVRTITINGTMETRWLKNKLITNEKIKPGDVIVGFASDGQASYETEYNSGIGSNGLTSARHDMLHKHYGARYHESYDTSLDDHVVYIGPHYMTDEVTLPEKSDSNIRQVNSQTINIGKLLLSPTRTYAPLVKVLLEDHFDAVHGMVHCSGGGQTKCMKYLPGNYRVIKDNLFDPPIIFKLIQESSKSNNLEMYQVFNMGHRLEVFTDKDSAEKIINAAQSFNIKAQIVGHIERSDKKELIIKSAHEEIVF